MSPPPIPDRQRSVRLIARWIVLGFAGLLLAGMAVLIAMRIKVSRDNQRELAAIRAEGMPAGGAELDAWYPAVPDQENAALVFLEAAQRLVAFPDVRTNTMLAYKYPSVAQPIAAADLEWMQAYVSQNREALQLARSGLAYSRSRYPVDLKPGYRASLTHLAQLKKLAQATRYEVELAAQAGEPERATEALGLILGIGRSLDQEPLLISFLVRISVLQMAHSALERGLSSCSFPETQLAHIERMLVESSQTNLLMRAFAGERATVLPIYQMNLAELRRAMSMGMPVTAPSNGEAVAQGLALSAFRITGFFERDLRFYLNSMRTNVLLAHLGPPGDLQLTDLTDQQYQTARKRYYILSSLLLPGLSKSAVREATSLATLRLARTAIAIERYRLANGRIPAQLQDLVPRFLPAVLPDPFNGEPLRFQRLEEGYLLYSVGEDQQDDGGKERVTGSRSSGEKATYDLTFRVLR